MQATEPAFRLPLFRALRPGCPGRGPDRPRDMRLAWVPARTLAGRFRPAMSATGPARSTRPSPALRADAKRDPTRWLAFHRLRRGPAPRENRCRQRNPDGLRLLEPRAPRQHARPRAFPPACIETFAIHPAAGVRGLWHGGGGCGKRWANMHVLPTPSLTYGLGLAVLLLPRGLSNNECFGKWFAQATRRAGCVIVLRLAKFGTRIINHSRPCWLH